MAERPSSEERRRALALAGFDLTEEQVAGLAERYDDVDATISSIRDLDVTAYEPYAVFAPRTAE